MSAACTTKYQSVYGELPGNERFYEMLRLVQLLPIAKGIDLDIVWSTYSSKVSTEEPEIDLTGIIWD